MNIEKPRKNRASLHASYKKYVETHKDAVFAQKLRNYHKHRREEINKNLSGEILVDDSDRMHFVTRYLLKFKSWSFIDEQGNKTRSVTNELRAYFIDRRLEDNKKKEINIIPIYDLKTSTGRLKRIILNKLVLDENSINIYVKVVVKNPLHISYQLLNS